MIQSVTHSLILIGLGLTLSACAQYQPSEAECFNTFAEVTRSNCSFDLLSPIAPFDG